MNTLLQLSTAYYTEPPLKLPTPKISKFYLFLYIVLCRLRDNFVYVNANCDNCALMAEYSYRGADWIQSPVITSITILYSAISRRHLRFLYY